MGTNTELTLRGLLTFARKSGCFVRSTGTVIEVTKGQRVVGQRMVCFTAKDDPYEVRDRMVETFDMAVPYEDARC